MNCLLHPTTNVEMSKYDSSIEIQSLDDVYATAPIAVIMPLETQALDEEEVYSSFELAISERQEALQQKLQLLSAPLPSHTYKIPQASTFFVCCCMLLNRINWRRVLLFSAFAFIFTLLGFDAMGLLMFCAR